MPKVKMKAALKNVLSTAEVAEALGCTTQNVRKRVPELIENGIARTNGKLAFFHKSCIEYLKNRPETRGRKPDNIDCVNKCQCASCVKLRTKKKAS